eukprot:241426_1
MSMPDANVDTKRRSSHLMLSETTVAQDGGAKPSDKTLNSLVNKLQIENQALKVEKDSYVINQKALKVENQALKETLQSLMDELLRNQSESLKSGKSSLKRDFAIS